MASLSGQFQTAYVTTDIERAASLFEARYEVGPFRTVDLPLSITTPSGPKERRLLIGLAWSGETQFELIQPVSGDVGIYRDPLPADGFALRFHHIAVRIRGNADDWQRLIDGLAAQDRQVAFTGEMGSLRFLYTDERSTLGHFVEYIQMSDEAFAAWKQR